MTQLSERELAGVASLLIDAGETVAGQLTATLVAGGRSNLTYRLDDGTSAWALRRPPAGAVIESAHDVAREYRVMAALRSTPVPVPRAVVCDATGAVLGVPAAVVAWVPSHTARSREDVADWSGDDYQACATGLVDALAALHEVDPAAVGLGEFGRPGSYAARQLRRWSGQWLRMDARDVRADRLHAMLVDMVPDQARTSIVHGDYRVDNVLLATGESGRVLAIVDWELSTLGDSVADVATMCAYRHPALDGVLGLEAAWTSEVFPRPEELRTSYEERTGRSLLAFDFHLALAFYKLAVIAEGIAYRHRAGVTAGDGYERVAAMVPILLEQGLEVASRGG
ncbi:phosphotransferase family protein [Nocardioides immobilis]|uniref:Phosphotransferase family protein n=1 Tax=Nocardioides immobilis TaxID=2049295 RepID=A0A417Y703_9ACTN|nr:phosphotransferase family protein [Nocardioides immobilis]RHW28347.1 phosphotransferase family protein [Nocardioides immobilis]